MTARQPRGSRWELYDIALRLPHAAGYLVRAEVAALRRLTADIRRPVTGALVWQYGITGEPGTAPGELDTPTASTCCCRTSRHRRTR